MRCGSARLRDSASRPGPWPLARRGHRTSKGFRSRLPSLPRPASNGRASCCCAQASTVSPMSSPRRPRWMYPARLVELTAAANSRPGPRRLVALDAKAQYPLRLEATLARSEADAPLVLDEIGLFKDARDVNRPFGLFEIRPEHEQVAVNKARNLLNFTLVISFSDLFLQSAAHRSASRSRLRDRDRTSVTFCSAAGRLGRSGPRTYGS